MYSSDQSLHNAMDEYTADALVNRDEPVPVIAVSGNHDLFGTSSDNEQSGSKRERLKESLSGSRLRDKMHGVGRPDARASLQDRLFSK